MSDVKSHDLTRRDWFLIGVLIALVLPLRLWLLFNTEVAARDSIGYIRYALQFERAPWNEVLKRNDQHPGYPTAIWLMSLPVRSLEGATTPENMVLSTQLVSFSAALILVGLMYLLGRQFFDRTVSFGAAILYQCLPISAHHLSDGISEPFYLVLLVSGLLHMVIAIRTRSIASSALCGAFAALAYLTRPEGLLIVPAFGIALLATQFRTEWRASWGRTFVCGLGMVLASLLFVSVYVYATERITNKPSAMDSLRNLWKWLISLATSGATQAGLHGSAHLFAASYPASDSNAIRLKCSLWALLAEICQGFHYVATVPALLGCWGSFATLRRHAGFWALALYGVLHSFILVALAMSVHYVSDRHVMILVMGGCYFVVFGLRELPRRVLAWHKAETPNPAVLPWYRSASMWFAILLLALIGVSLPKATQRLHAHRVGNHQAGLWLADHLQIGDVIEDDHNWSHFYAGLLFEEGREPVLPVDHESICYVVTTRSRDVDIDAKRQTAKIAPDARIVFVWPPHSDAATARVIVYAQRRSFKTHPWRVAPP